MASIDIRSSAGQTDMDVEDLDFNFRGHDGEDADRCGDTSNVTPALSPVSYTHLTLPTILRV